MKSNYTFHNGVFQDYSVQPPRLAGYIFNFQGHGAFSPDGKVPATLEQIASHNRMLGQMELQAMKKHGRAVLYLFGKNGETTVGTWASEPFQRARVYYQRQSRNNWGVKRTDVWFMADGSRWWGVNLGDNDIVRCKRCKS